MLFFYTSSPVVFNIVENYIVNPDNKQETIVKQYNGKEYKFFDESVYSKVSLMLQIISYIFLIISVISLILIKIGEKKLYKEEIALEKSELKKSLLNKNKYMNSIADLK